MFGSLRLKAFPGSLAQPNPHHDRRDTDGEQSGERPNPGGRVETDRGDIAAVIGVAFVAPVAVDASSGAASGSSPAAVVDCDVPAAVVLPVVT